MTIWHGYDAADAAAHYDELASEHAELAREAAQEGTENAERTVSSADYADRKDAEVAGQ